MSHNSKTVAFFGASGGVGLSALKLTLAAGHQCIALCRVPSKFAAIFPTGSAPNNLKIVQGDAHDIASVTKCLQQGSDGKLALIDDPEVCRKGAATLLESIAELRRGGATGNPHIIVCSTTGISRFGRDIPIAMVPLYKILLKIPHDDKKSMEDRLIESQESYTIVHPSFFIDGKSINEVRVGIEDPKSGRESEAIGYTISREDVGKWIAENLVRERDAKYNNKIAMITY